MGAYFISMILVGSFFIINLAMAVVWDQYAAADEERRAKVGTLGFGLRFACMHVQYVCSGEAFGIN